MEGGEAASLGPAASQGLSTSTDMAEQPSLQQTQMEEGQAGHDDKRQKLGPSGTHGTG